MIVYILNAHARTHVNARTHARTHTHKHIHTQAGCEGRGKHLVLHNFFKQLTVGEEIIDGYPEQSIAIYPIMTVQEPLLSSSRS
jgi:hypothetical protein